MNVVGFIPYWMDYRAEKKDGTPRHQRTLGGRHLINYSIGLLNRIRGIQRTIIYASQPTILQHVDSDLYYSFVKRPSLLDSPLVCIEEIVTEFLKETDADIVVLLHPNSPFLTRETVQDCVDQVVSGEYDSAFTAYKFQKFAWFKSVPLNYDLALPTPQLRDIEPVLVEQSSLYVFTKNIFAAENSRVGGRQYVKLINHFEGHEINEPEDFAIAELIVNSGMYSDL